MTRENSRLLRLEGVAVLLLAVWLYARGDGGWGFFAPEQVALIWAAHIGMDRALGYGLKETSGFTETHLGRVGRGSVGIRMSPPTVHSTS